MSLSLRLPASRRLAPRRNPAPTVVPPGREASGRVAMVLSEAMVRWAAPVAIRVPVGPGVIRVPVGPGVPADPVVPRPTAARPMAVRPLGQVEPAELGLPAERPPTRRPECSARVRAGLPARARVAPVVAQQAVPPAVTAAP